MGDRSVEVTEENRDASQEAKAQAMEAISEGILILPHYISPICMQKQVEIDGFDFIR